MIVLIGFMGAGKSTVGRLLAGRIGLPFVDTDVLIEDRSQRLIAEIFESEGEPGFREREREIVLEVLEGRDSVVALGGGALADPQVAMLLESRDVVYLRVSFGEAIRRVGDDPTRPMLKRPRLQSLYADRAKDYELFADITVDTDKRDPHEIALDLAVQLRGPSVAEEHVQKIVVPLAHRTYEIHVGRGVADRMVDLIAQIGGAEKAFLVTHPELEVLGKGAIVSLLDAGLDVDVLHVPAGEGAKSLDSVMGLWDGLVERKAHRDDVIVAFGGGVISDVAGFVASTYMRGVPLINVPTTLLGQVDAAIGGKCGVNLPAGKNLIGTIYQPRAVVCDVDLLASCPRDELRSGLAEVVKYGFIADPDLLDFIDRRVNQALDGDARVLIEIVGRAAGIKASIVATDELDHGRRAFLNYGHTIAHALEQAAGYEGIRHGEAVGLGMLGAAHLAHLVGYVGEDVVERHRRILELIGLPTSATIDPESLEQAWARDKKYSKGLRFVLLRAIGRPEAGVRVDEADLREALKRLSQ